MSLSWPRRLHVAVCPEGAALMVLGGLPKRVLHHAAWIAEPLDAALGSWEPVVQSLRKHLVPQYHHARRVSITLSNHFCRYGLFPNPAALSGRSELLAYARHRMGAAFGDALEPWDLRLSTNKQAVLVCAAPRALLDALRDLLQEYRLPVVSIQPYFPAVFNRFRTRIGEQSGWFIVQEPGRAVIGRFDQGRWAALVSRRGADTPEGLLKALERERLAHASGGHDLRSVWLASSVKHYLPRDFAGCGYDVTLLPASLPKGLGIDDGLRYAMAA